MRRPMKIAAFIWSHAPALPLIAHELPVETTGEFRWDISALPMLGKGTTRHVWDLGDGTVLKTCFGRAAHRGPYCPCLDEHKFWGKIHAEAGGALFAPTYEAGDCWVRMKKADSVPVPCLGGCPGGMPYGADWYRKAAAKIYQFYPHDIHPGQFGIFGGQYKLLDYGD